MTTDNPHARGPAPVTTRLTATLLSGERLFPIVVTSLSERGFAAEGVSLDSLGEEFLLEMTLPPIGDVAWSPKAPPPPVRTPNARVRARARLSALTPSEAGTSACKGLAGSFEHMSESCRAALRGWLARLAGAQGPLSRGCGPREL